MGDGLKKHEGNANGSKIDKITFLYDVLLHDATALIVNIHFSWLQCQNGHRSSRCYAAIEADYVANDNVNVYDEDGNRLR